MKLQKIIDGIRYNFDVWMMEPIDGMYRFGLQGWSNGKIFSYSMRLPQEFLESEIDNEKNKDYLENIATCVVDNNLKNILALNPGEIAVNLQVWFKEAKQQIEDSTKNCSKCESEMFKSMEPKVANLANINSKFPNQSEYWRCSNKKCGYKEKI